MGMWSTSGNRIKEIVKIKEGYFCHWPLQLQEAATVWLSVMVQDGVGVYVQTMPENEFQRLSTGRYNIIKYLSSSTTHTGRYLSHYVSLPKGAYRLMIGVDAPPDNTIGWQAYFQHYAVASVRFDMVH